MGARQRRNFRPGDGNALREFAELARPGRGSITAQARLRRLVDVGDRLGMTSGDTLRLATETLRALDARGELAPAIGEVLEAFDSGRLITEFREPMNLYLERPAVSALAVAVCEVCRPSMAVAGPPTEAIRVPDEPAPAGARHGRDVGSEWPGQAAALASRQFRSATLWPERTHEGFPQMTLEVEVWWPGLPEWEPATLTASVNPSRSFAGGNFTLLIEQPGDPDPTPVYAVWLLKREDLAADNIPVYELRASIWDEGDDAHEFRFLFASSSLWCAELHDYLATRWISNGQSPAGPGQFDSVPLGGDHPPVRLVAAR